MTKTKTKTKAKTTSPISSKKKKEKAKMQDGGLGPAEIAKIRQANRQLWQRSSLARKLVVKRCLRPDGFSTCEQCNQTCPKVAVDHTNKVGLVDSGYLERLWVSSNEMKGLCKSCHDKKTAQERKEDAAMAKKLKEYNFNTEPLPTFDDDIEAMDIYTHQKVELQEKRNENKNDFNLDELIGKTIKSAENDSLNDLF